MNQERFLAAIRQALGGDPRNPKTWADVYPVGAADAQARCLEKIRDRTSAERRALVDRLVAAATPVNMRVIPKPDLPTTATAIADLVWRKTPEWGTVKQVAVWQHPTIDALNLPRLLSRQHVPVVITPQNGSDPRTRSAFREQVIASFIGVTSADYCVAETASLALRTRPGQGRTVSLVPSIHVVVITLDQMLADLQELYTCLGSQNEGLTNCLTLISGPSKTADIEAHMVHGAHGPREMHLYVVAAT